MSFTSPQPANDVILCFGLFKLHVNRTCFPEYSFCWTFEVSQLGWCALFFHFHKYHKYTQKHKVYRINHTNILRTYSCRLPQCLILCCNECYWQVELNWLNGHQWLFLVACWNSGHKWRKNFHCRVCLYLRLMGTVCLGPSIFKTPSNWLHLCLPFTFHNELHTIKLMHIYLQQFKSDCERIFLVYNYTPV